MKHKQTHHFTAQFFILILYPFSSVPIWLKSLLYLFWKVCPAVRRDVWFHVSIFKLIEAKRYKIPVWSIPGGTCAATVGHLIRNTHKCPIPPLRNECTHRTVAVRTVSTKPLLRHMSNNAGYAECSLTDFLSTMCYCLTKTENIWAYLFQQNQRGWEASDDSRTNRGNRERRCSSACPPQKSLLWQVCRSNQQNAEVS